MASTHLRAFAVAVIANTPQASDASPGEETKIFVLEANFTCFRAEKASAEDGPEYGRRVEWLEEWLRHNMRASFLRAEFWKTFVLRPRASGRIEV